MLTVESQVETRAGEYDRAQVALDEALALFRRLGAPRRIWMYQLINVGWIALHRHDFGRAREALEEYLAEESWKNPVGIANAECNLAAVAVCEGDRDEADRRFRQALAYAREPRATAHDRLRAVRTRAPSRPWTATPSGPFGSTVPPTA